MIGGLADAGGETVAVALPGLAAVVGAPDATVPRLGVAGGGADGAVDERGVAGGDGELGYGL
ncbi:MAG: hypothetical protein ABFE07_01370, partial [Armatimonadia bacterium]